MRIYIGGNLDLYQTTPTGIVIKLEGPELDSRSTQISAN